MSNLEQELRRDLSELKERVANDNEFSRDLYRALASNTWHKEGAGGHVALSWGKAEELVNELRTRVAEEPLELEQTGGEGEIAASVRRDLEALGWTAQPLNTSRHDPQHVSQGEEPPPKGTGERLAPTDGTDWEEIAHEETDAGPPPVPDGQGLGGGGAAGSAGRGSQSG